LVGRPPSVEVVEVAALETVHTLSADVVHIRSHNLFGQVEVVVLLAVDKTLMQHAVHDSVPADAFDDAKSDAVAENKYSAAPGYGAVPVMALCVQLAAGHRIAV